jgi:hypothetical protein
MRLATTLVTTAFAAGTSFVAATAPASAQVPTANAP